MNFSVMEIFALILGFVLAISLAINFIFKFRFQGFRMTLNNKDSEIKIAEELLNRKDKEFELYRKKVAADKILITQGFVKSLFVLEHEPKFPKGYDCEDFVVINVTPEIPDFKIDTKYGEISESFILFLTTCFSKDLPKNSLKQIEKLRPEVYYSYKVFSKLDKKEMVVREEYLEELIKNKN